VSGRRQRCRGGPRLNGRCRGLNRTGRGKNDRQMGDVWDNGWVAVGIVEGLWLCVEVRVGVCGVCVEGARVV
jgi:hypothetical protein